MRHWIRTFVALVRVEVRGLAPAAIGLAACVLLGLMWARFFGGLAAPVGSAAWIGLFVSIAVLIALPLVGLPFDGAGRAPVTGALRPLPVRGPAVLLAKLAATLLALLGAMLAIVLVDAPLASFSPAHETGRVAALLASEGYVLYVCLAAVPAVGLALVAAAVLESALASTIVSLAVAVSPLLLASGSDIDTRTQARAEFLYSIGVPVVIAIEVVAGLFILHALCSRALRGRRSRSAVRRVVFASAFTLTATAGLATAVEVGAASVRRHARTLTWDNPEATISELRCDSGERFALVKLMDRDADTPAASYWTLDRKTLEVERLTLPELGLATSGRHISNVGSPDTEGACFAFESSVWHPRSAPKRVFRCKPGEEPKALTRDEYRSRTTVGAWHEPGPFHILGEGWDDARALGWFRGGYPGRAKTGIALPDGLEFVCGGRTQDVPIVLRGVNGELHEIDPTDGAPRALGVSASSAADGFRLSPRGRWLAFEDGECGVVLVDLTTGRYGSVGELRGARFMDRDAPFVFHTGRDGWIEVGLDGRRPLDIPPDAYPYDLDGERWLVLTHPARGLFVHDADGRRIQTLRPELL